MLVSTMCPISLHTRAFSFSPAPAAAPDTHTRALFLQRLPEVCIQASRADVLTNRYQNAAQSPFGKQFARRTNAAGGCSPDWVGVWGYRLMRVADRDAMAWTDQPHCAEGRYSTADRQHRRRAAQHR